MVAIKTSRRSWRGRSHVARTRALANYVLAGISGSKGAEREMPARDPHRQIADHPAPKSLHIVRR
jgi:hypothetical protein